MRLLPLWLPALAGLTIDMVQIETVSRELVLYIYSADRHFESTNDMDRDPIFTAGVRGMLRRAGANPVRLPRRSPLRVG